MTGRPFSLLCDVVAFPVRVSKRECYVAEVWLRDVFACGGVREAMGESSFLQCVGPVVLLFLRGAVLVCGKR